MKPYYQDHLATIYCADAREVLPYIGPFDAVVTDIPYEVVSRADNGLRDLDKGDADVGTMGLSTVVDECVRTAITSYVWCSTEQVSEMRAQFEAYGLSTRLCIWHKTNPSPLNGQHLWLSGVETCVFARRPKAYFAPHCEVPVWKGPIVRGQQHPTQKPVWLMKIQVEASVPPGGTVLDFCMGSGTTGVAATTTGRRFVGIELNEEYCKIAVERLKSGK